MNLDGTAVSASMRSLGLSSIAELPMASGQKPPKPAMTVKPWTASRGPRVNTPDADTSLRKLLENNQGAPAGRLSSEDYGMGVLCDGMPAGPTVRRKGAPTVKPRHTWQMADAEKEARARGRPRRGIDGAHDSAQQQWTREGAGRRSSDTIGAGARPVPAKSKWPRVDRMLHQRSKSAHELNYLAQFLYNDPRVPPVGGVKQRSIHTDILDAVSWQQRALAKARQLDDWNSRLDMSVRTDKGGMRGGEYDAHRVAEMQRWADILEKKTQNSAGAEMQREAFDSVYSELHVNKDTYSTITSGSLVPAIDHRVPRLEVSTNSVSVPLQNNRRTLYLPTDKPLLPTRVCGIGTGKGRSIDF